MSRFRPFVCGLLMLALALPLVRAELVWRPGEGWSDESGGDISASSSRDQLEMAHKLQSQGQRDDALKAYKGLIRRWPLSFFAPEAQFQIGKIYEEEGDFAAAFKAFQVMVQKYPNSDYFEQALKEQYQIANLYLAGEPQRIWKIPVGPSMDRTVEMYERVVKNAPYGTYAPQCQFNIGLAREKQRKFSDAIEAYQKVIDNYPQSAEASNAQYQIGYAWMKSTLNGDYDLGAAKKAIDAFQDFLVRYPTSDKAAQAQENIKRLGQKQTQGAYDVAKFYETQHDPRAAFIYYNEVIREDPISPQAQLAKKRIQELRPILEAMPGGLGPDGTGSLATAPQVASNPNLPSTDTPPDSGGNGNGGGTLPMPDPSANSPLPTDPDAPVTTAFPGATAAGQTSTPPSTNTDNAPISPLPPGPPPANASTPSDGTPAPAPADSGTPAPSAPMDPAPAPAPAAPSTDASTNAAPSAPAAPSDKTSSP